MAAQMQCTMKGCYLKFPSYDAMKKHKAKTLKNPNEHIHDFYCKRCDFDADNDIEYLIHQIQSAKHSRSTKITPGKAKEISRMSSLRPGVSE